MRWRAPSRRTTSASHARCRLPSRTHEPHSQHLNRSPFSGPLLVATGADLRRSKHRELPVRVSERATQLLVGPEGCQRGPGPTEVPPPLLAATRTSTDAGPRRLLLVAIRADPRRSKHGELPVCVSERASHPLVGPGGHQRCLGQIEAPLPLLAATRTSTRRGPSTAAAGRHRGRSASLKARRTLRELWAAPRSMLVAI